MPKTERPSRFRLSPDVRPREYDIHLEPDLDAGRFRGEVRIAVGLDRARREVVLHALATGRLCPADWQPGQPTLDPDLRY